MFNSNRNYEFLSVFYGSGNSFHSFPSRVMEKSDGKRFFLFPSLFSITLFHHSFPSLFSITSDGKEWKLFPDPWGKTRKKLSNSVWNWTKTYYLSKLDLLGKLFGSIERKVIWGLKVELLFSHLSNNSRTGIECWWWSSSSLVFSKGSRRERERRATFSRVAVSLAVAILHIFNVDSLHCGARSNAKPREARKHNNKMC